MMSEARVEEALRSLAQEEVKPSPFFKRRLIAVLRREAPSRVSVSHLPWLRWQWLGGLVAFLLLVWGMGIVWTPRPRLTVQQGHAVVARRPASSGAPVAAQTLTLHQNQALARGDAVQVSADSRAQLDLDGSHVELLPGTQITLTDAQLRSPWSAGMVHLRVESGALRAEVAPLRAPEERFEVEAPYALVSVRGTVFRVRVVAPQHTYVATDEGIVLVTLYDPAQGNPQVEVPAGYEVDAKVGQPLRARPQLALAPPPVTHTLMASPTALPENPLQLPALPAPTWTPAPSLTPTAAPTAPAEPAPTGTPVVVLTAAPTVPPATPFPGSGAPIDDPRLLLPPVTTDIALTLRCAPSPVLPLSLLRCTFGVINRGYATARQVTVVARLPNQVEFQSASVSFKLVSGTMTWALGDLGVGASREVGLEMRVRPDAVGAVTLDGQVNSVTPDDFSENNTAAATTTVVPVANLHLEGTVSAVERNVVTYTLYYRNAGPATAEDVVFVGWLPAAITLGNGGVMGRPPMSGTLNYGTLVLDANARLIGLLPELAAGAEGNLVFTATTQSLAPGAFTTTLAITATTLDTDLTDNRWNATQTLRPHADLAVAFVSAPQTAASGDTLTYTLVYANQGPSPAETVQITATLPDELVWGGVVRATPALSLSQALSLPHLAAVQRVWYLPTLAPGSVGTVVFTATLEAANTASLTAALHIGSRAFDWTPGNNRAIITTTILRPALEAHVHLTPTRAVPAMPLTCTVTLFNTGALPFAPGALQARASLPPGWTHRPLAGESAALADASVWTNTLLLLPGASLSFTFGLSPTRLISAGAELPRVWITATAAQRMLTHTLPLSVSVVPPTLVLDPQMDVVWGNGRVTLMVVVSNTGPSGLDVVPLRLDYPASGWRLLHASFQPMTETGVLLWPDLTAAQAKGRNLLPGESVRLTATFAVSETACAAPLVQRVRVAGLRDVYGNLADRVFEQLSWAARAYLPVILRARSKP